MNSLLNKKTAGYVLTAPACGDCQHSRSYPVSTDTLYCTALKDDVADAGRCLYWMPSEVWLRVNTPAVATGHRVFGLMPGRVFDYKQEESNV